MAWWKSYGFNCELSSPVCYGISLLAVGLSTVIALLLDPYVGDTAVSPSFFLAVAVTIWFTRTGPSVFAIVLSGLVDNWFFIPPRYTLYFDIPHLVTIGMFWTASFIFVVLAKVMRDAMTSAEANAQAACRQQRELEALVEAVPAGIWRTHDPSCRYIWGNQEATKILKLPPGANLSKTPPPGEPPQGYDFYNQGQVIPAEELPIQTAVRLGQPIWGKELEVRFSDGSRRWIYGNSVPLRNEAGEVWGAVGSLMDITQRKEMELQLKKAQAELELRVKERTAELNETVNELEHFSYSITHDMRAPLRAMSAFIQMAMEQGGNELVNPLAKDYLQRVAGAAQRMDRLIVDALNYSKVTRSQLTLGPVDVADLLRQITQTYLNLQPQQLDVRLEGDFPLVQGNVAFLTECFSNLLGNAVKFACPGTFPRVRVWAEPRNGSVRLWFADNGIGIPRGKEARIFEMFERLSTKHEGTGIGLAIVRKAAKRMGGEVGVESEEGKGSRFWLELRRVDRGV